MSEHLEVVGHGTATTTPDVVTLDLRVNVDGTDVSTPLTKASTLMSEIHTVAREFGVEDRDLRTSGAGVQQRWGGEPHGPIGFTAFQRVTIRLRSPERAGALISRAEEAADDHFALDGISMTVSDPAAALESARAAAFADARAKAEQYATLAQRRLGRVLTVSEFSEGSGHGGGPEMRLMAAKADLPVAAGEDEIGARVVVRWAWAGGQDA